MPSGNVRVTASQFSLRHTQGAGDRQAELFDSICTLIILTTEIITRLFYGRPEKPEGAGIFAEDVTSYHVGQARPSRRLRIEIHANGNLSLLTALRSD